MFCIVHVDCDVLSEVNDVQNDVLRSPRGQHVFGDVNNDQRILCLLVHVGYDVLSEVILDQTIF